MKETTDDLRARFSKKVIKDSLINLLKVKSITKVTVTELCIEAKINRGTFYNHFYDINDVYNSIQDDFYNGIVSTLEKKNITAIDNSYFKEIIQYILKNPIVTRIMIEEFSNNSLLKKLINYTERKFIEDFNKVYPTISKDTIRDFSTFIINGTIGLLIKYLKDPKKKSVDYINNFILNISKGIMGEFIAKEI